jgi:hypothetical protein
MFILRCLGNLLMTIVTGGAWLIWMVIKHLTKR